MHSRFTRRSVIASLGAASLGAFKSTPALAASTRRATGFIRTNWSRDPFAYGSYSFFAKGSRRRQTGHLFEPVGETLFFAGEAANPDRNSTVHAALEAGRLAALQVLAGDAQRVCVIGAGISGMGAADVLDREGRGVTVIEARDRIGGRIWTDGRLGAPVDLGASWVHGHDGNPLTVLAQQRGMQQIETGFDFVIRGGDGRLMSEDETPDWIDEVTEVQHSAGALISEINQRAYIFGSDYGGEERVFPGGYRAIFDGLATGADVRLGAAVTGIATTEADATVTLEVGTEETFDAVIVSVPLGVLKRGAITFTPALPDRKQRAIEDLGMGLLDKVYLRYDDVFWDADSTWIITPETGLPPGQFNQWLNMAPIVGEPIIMAFNGAQPARDLAALSDEEVVSRAQQVMSLTYPV